MAFQGVACFYLDSRTVAGAAEAGLARIDLYCLSKPSANNNASGINNPGVTITLVPTSNSIPVMGNFDNCPKARLEYPDVQASPNASIGSIFRFPNPVPVITNQQYGIVIQADGDEDYVFWGCVAGANLVGTTTKAPQFPGTFLWYPYLSTIPLGSNVSLANTGLIGTSNVVGSNTPVPNSAVTSGWLPLAGFCPKLEVYVARYAFSGNTNLSAFANQIQQPGNTPIQITCSPGGTVNVGGGSACCAVTLPCVRYEYICYDRHYSHWWDCSVGERCHQRRPYHWGPTWPVWVGGAVVPVTCGIVANSDLCTIQSGHNWTDLFTFQTVAPEYVVVWSLNHFGAGKHRIQVREVIEQISNTVIRLDANCNITNSVCWFYKAPVATLVSQEPTEVFGFLEDTIILRDSNANDVCRFANHCIEDVTIVAGGTGYANTDYIIVTGFETITGGIVFGGFNCAANLITNSTGGITNCYIVNAGCGFVNASTIQILVLNSSGSNSVGTGFNLTCNVSTTVWSEFLGSDGSGGFFKNCRLVNFEFGEIIPGIVINQPAGCFYTATHRLCYYSRDDDDYNEAHGSSHFTFRGRSYFCDDDNDCEFVDVKRYEAYPCYNFRKRRCLPSWSNEWIICYEANGTTCNAAGGSTTGNTPSMTSNCSVVYINSGSNSDFVSPGIDGGTTTITFSKFIVNDDETNENTNSGNALARGVETQVFLANGQNAEDFLAWATVYRPSNTDVELYVKMHNLSDPDQFLNKDWTRLTQLSSQGLFSTTVDPTTATTNGSLAETPAAYVAQISNAQPNNWIEISYGLAPYPNNTILVGTVATTNASYTITGSGTAFQSNTVINLHPQDLVLFYQTLFPADYMVSVVNTVANDTSFTIVDPVTNNGVIASGMTIAKILYPHQMFKNGLNSNVARYYNSTMTPYDTFSTFQMKVVMLAADERIVPAVNDVRATAISS